MAQENYLDLECREIDSGQPSQCTSSCRHRLALPGEIELFVNRYCKVLNNERVSEEPPSFWEGLGDIQTNCVTAGDRYDRIDCSFLVSEFRSWTKIALPIGPLELNLLMNQ